jgi:hypothetical protein
MGGCGAARLAITFFAGSRLAVCFAGSPFSVIGFGVAGAKVENAGNKLGVIFSNVNADCRGWAAPRTTLEGGVIYGLLLSKTTLSGSVSIELILMTGLSILL